MAKITDLRNLEGLDLAEEVFEELHRVGPAVVERIVSNGAGTHWYDQDHDEWVLVLVGAAELEYGDGRRMLLGPGECTTIPSHVRHRVTWTQQPTVWVAVHFPPGP